MSRTWKTLVYCCILLIPLSCMEAQWLVQQMEEYDKKQKEEAEAKKKYASEPEFTEPLASLPEGVQFPVPLKYKVNYDPTRQVLTCRGVMKEEEKNMLLVLSGDPSYQEAVKKLYQNTLPKPVEIPVVSVPAHTTEGEKPASTTGPEVVLRDGNVMKGNIKGEFDFQTELATLKIKGEDVVSYLA
ncbi:MAG: hypothetical protein ACK4WF_05465, partial [Candidatus Brocadiales bacterium]